MPPKLSSEVGHLDVLVNNAGLMFGSPPSLAEESIDEIQQMFSTNVFGVMRVTQAFLPLLRKSKAARIVMMSSGLSSLTDALDMRSETWTVGFGGYCASKTALNMLTVKLAKELDREGIKVNAVDPGLTSTDMTGNGPGHSPEDGARPAFALATTHAYGPTAGFYACAPSGELVQRVGETHSAIMGCGATGSASQCLLRADRRRSAARRVAVGFSVIPVARFLAIFL